MKTIKQCIWSPSLSTVISVQSHALYYEPFLFYLPDVFCGNFRYTDYDEVFLLEAFSETCHEKLHVRERERESKAYREKKTFL